MQSIGSATGFSVLVGLLLVAPGCNKAPSGAEAIPSAAAAAAPASAASPVASSAAAAPVGEPLTGLDACLVGSWKSTVFTLKNEQVTAEGGGNTTLRVAAGGDAVVDFTGMAPIRGKGGGADFDFQYAGKATATISTPTRGAIASTKADVSALRVNANVALPGAGKFPILKNQAVSELAQMASRVTTGKKPTAATAAAAAGASPPGVDSNPLFSTTHYACEGNALTLSGEGPTWAFTRIAP